MIYSYSTKKLHAIHVSHIEINIFNANVMVFYTLISCNVFIGVNLILLIDLFPVHWLTRVLHHCIAVPLSESKSQVHIIMETDCLQ